MLPLLCAVLLLCAAGAPAHAHPRDDGDHWSEIAPPSRVGHVAAFDAHRQRLIVFGGAVGGTIFGDVWVLSLSSRPRWERLDVPGESPSPRVCAAAAFDPDHGRLLIQGGRDASGRDLDDTWELRLDGRLRWRRLVTTGTPPALSGHTLTMVPGDNAIVIGGYPPQVWNLSLTSLGWSRPIPTGTAPAPRRGQSAVYCPALGGVLMFGGATGGLEENNDLWVLKVGPTLSWEPLYASGSLAPCAMQGHIAAWDDVGQRMIVFATEPFQSWQCFTAGSVWSLSVPDLVWKLLVTAKDGPGPRSYSAAIFDPASRCLYVHGGGGSPLLLQPPGNASESDTWCLSLEPRAAWRRIHPRRDTPPSAFLGNRFVLDPRQDRVLADIDGSQFTWSFDLRSESWAPIAATNDTLQHFRGGVAVMDTRRDRMVRVLPRRTIPPFLPAQYVWSLDPGRRPTWRPLPVAGEPPEIAGAAIYDPVRDRLLLYTSDYFRPARSGVWALAFSECDSARWYQVSSPADTGRARPPSALGPSVAYDSRRDRMIVFGGGYSSPDYFFPVNACYSLRLEGSPDWEVLSAESRDPSVPSPRSDAACIYDEGRDRLVVLGGAPGSFISHLSDDAWSLAVGTREWTRLDDAGRPGWTLPASVYDPRRDRTIVLEEAAVWRFESGGAPWRMTTMETAPSSLIVTLELEGARPNPSTGDLSVSFALPDVAPASLEMFDVAGRKVWSRDVAAMGPGRHTVVLSSTHARAPGLYLLRLTHGREALTSKVVRLIH